MIDMCCPECGYVDSAFPSECRIVVSGHITMRPDREGTLAPSLSRSINVLTKPTYDGGEVSCPNCGHSSALEDFVRVQCSGCGRTLDRERYKEYLCSVRSRVYCDECFGYRRNLDYCSPCDRKPDCIAFQRLVDRRENE